MTRDRDVVRRRVLDRVVAGEAPDPHRREHVEVGRERPHADTSKRTWSLPLPVQPCATASAPNSRAAAHEVPGDHRTRQRRHQRVLALVQRVGLDRPARCTPSANSARGVDDERLDRTGRERALA